MTGTFIQPDFETQGGTAYKSAIDNAFAVLKRIGAMFAPHEQDIPDMTVLLDVGAVLVNNVLTEIAAQSTGTIPAPAATYSRIDRVVIDAITGAVSVITGTPIVGTPVAPVITTGKLPVCQVLLASSTTTITNGLITDERVLGGGGGGEAFPVGAIYLSVTGTNPATELGYGTWVDVGYYNTFPQEQSTIYVKATSIVNTSYEPYFCTDPALSLIGESSGKSWCANAETNQRLHIDLWSTKLITGVYYENYHNSGTDTNIGAKIFTLWGSNNATAFATLTYATDTNWTQLTTDISQMVQHTASNIADPHYIKVTSTIPYRYIAFKFANAWGGPYIGLRRLVVLTGASKWLRTA